MLTSFEIKNFRTFSHLRIERLGRVNLIVGKNNVGKTTLLEALHVYTAENPRVVHENLADRDELLFSGVPGEAHLDYGSLFHGRQPAGHEIILGPAQGTGAEGRLTIELVEMEREEDSDGNVDYHEITDSDVEPEGEIVDGLGIRLDGGPGRLYQPHRPRWKYLIEPDVAYIRTEDVPSGLLGRWWDSIAGTDYEREAIDSLSIVAPFKLVRLVNDPTRQAGRVFRVRMEGATDLVPLKSLGGGPFRLFEIATAVAYLARMSASHQKSAQKAPSDIPEEALGRRVKTLLIDEIENGIHHTLHAKLWRLILRLAQEYNLQVFATSHSWDCIEGFQKALEADGEADGLLIRLETKEDIDKSRAVIFDRDELPIVTRESIEVR